MFDKINRSVVKKIIFQRMVIFVFAALFILICLYFINYSFIKREHSEFQKTSTMSEANNVSERIGLSIAEVMSLSKRPIITQYFRGVNRSWDINDFLSTQLDKDIVQHADVLSIDGISISNSLESGSIESDPKHLAINKYLAKEYSINKKSFISLIDYSSLLVRFYAIEPITDANGRNIALAKIEIDHEFLYNEIGSTTLKGTKEQMVIDDRGIIFHSGLEEDELQTIGNMDDPEKKRIIDNAFKFSSSSSSSSSSEFYFINQGYEKINNIIDNYQGPDALTVRIKRDKVFNELLAISKIGSENLYLISKSDLGTIQLEAAKITMLQSFIAIFILLVATIITDSIIKRVLSPIQQILKGTQSIIHGNYEVKLPVEGSNELAEIAQDLETITNTIKSVKAGCAVCDMNKVKEALKGTEEEV